jgi:hypothetical protein
MPALQGFIVLWPLAADDQAGEIRIIEAHGAQHGAVREERATLP